MTDKDLIERALQNMQWQLGDLQTFLGMDSDRNIRRWIDDSRDMPSCIRMVVDMLGEGDLPPRFLKGAQAGPWVQNCLDNRRGADRYVNVLTKPLDYDLLDREDKGRAVIYDFGIQNRPPEVGTLSSFRNGLCFVRFNKAIAASACDPARLRFVLEMEESDV